MKKETYSIHSINKLSADIIDMWVKADDIAKNAVPGQFVSIYCDDKSTLLPRPISICDTDSENGLLRLVFRIAGKGTKEFSEKKAGDTLDIIGPLGNGYTASFESIKAMDNPSVTVMGGGIGIPPMLKTAKALNSAGINVNIVLGYRDFLFLNDEFSKYGNVYLSTEDGSFGTKGNVIDCIRENDIKSDAILACGPLPMLRGIKSYAADNNIKTWISLEEKMACGIGACLACVCKSTDTDSHSMVKNKRICKDGPVFDAMEVDFS